MSLPSEEEFAYVLVGVIFSTLIGTIVGTLTWPIHLFSFANRPIERVVRKVWLVPLALTFVCTLWGAIFGFFAALISFTLSLIVYRATTPVLVPEGLCPNCEYDISSHVPRDGKCPECGLAIKSQASATQQSSGAK